MCEKNYINWMRYDEMVVDMSDEDKELCAMYEAFDRARVYSNGMGVNYAFQR